MIPRSVVNATWTSALFAESHSRNSAAFVLFESLLSMISNFDWLMELTSFCLAAN